MLRVDPTERIQAVDALVHPWLHQSGPGSTSTRRSFRATAKRIGAPAEIAVLNVSCADYAVCAANFAASEVLSTNALTKCQVPILTMQLEHQSEHSTAQLEQQCKNSSHKSKDEEDSQLSERSTEQPESEAEKEEDDEEDDDMEQGSYFNWFHCCTHRPL